MATDKAGKVSPFTVLAEHCLEVSAKTKKPRDLFDFRRQSHVTKMRMLGRLGLTDVMVSPPIESVAGKKWRPEGVHINMWMSLLEKVFPLLSGINVEILELLFAENEEAGELRKKIFLELETEVGSEGIHLMPIHCPQSDEHPDGHWTLLSLETIHEPHAGRALKVRYYETLHEPNPVCLERANKILDMLGVEAKAERSNIFSQCGDDCTYWVLHYCEVEARRHHREGGGACFAIGNPLRKPQLRHQLQLASKQLEEARKKWLDNELKERAKNESVRKMVETRMGRTEYVRLELERLRRRALVAAEELHTGSEDLADPEVAVENKKKAAEEKMKLSIEAAFKKIDELGEAEELKNKAKQEEQKKKAKHEEQEEKAKHEEEKKEDEGQDKVDEDEDKALEKNEDEDNDEQMNEEGAELPVEDEGKEPDKEKGVEKEEKPEEESAKEPEEVLILRRFDAGFEKWLCHLTEAQLEKVVSRLMKDHPNEAATKNYLECVQSMEHMVRYCSKCRHSGCERCDYIKSLRFIVRHQKPADWWQRSSHEAVLGTVRFLNAKK